MRYTILALFLFYGKMTPAQINLVALNQRTIPQDIKYSGQVKNAVRWSDHSGTHYVITSETGIRVSKLNPDDREAALYAYHYLSAKDSFRLTWKVYDFIKECPVDLIVSYMENGFGVTDLDRDGDAEVWLLYKTACHGDVSPSDMKIIMYEKDKKYTVRGRTKVKVSANEYEGGEFTIDAAFKLAPAVFRNYAQALWKKHRMETWE